MAIINNDLKDLSDKLNAMSDAAALAESDLRCSFDWAGQTLPCVGGPQFEGKDMDVGGWVQRRKVKIKFRLEKLADATTRPQRNHTVVYRGAENAIPVTYKVKSTKNFFDVLMELECEEDLR